MRIILLWIGIVFVSVCLSAGAHGASVEAIDSGLVVHGGTMGDLVLSYPELTVPGSDKTYKIIEKDTVPGGTLIKYVGGTSLKISVDDPRFRNGTVRHGSVGATRNSSDRTNWGTARFIK